MIAIGSDHGGLQLKEAVRNYLVGRGLIVDDLGTNKEDSVDYPDFGAKVAAAVSRQIVAKGILICGTGIGMSIAANKVRGIRAAHGTSVDEVRLARAHNDANILALGGRFP